MYDSRRRLQRTRRLPGHRSRDGNTIELMVAMRSKLIRIIWSVKLLWWAINMKWKKEYALEGTRIFGVSDFIGFTTIVFFLQAASAYIISFPPTFACKYAALTEKKQYE